MIFLYYLGDIGAKVGRAGLDNGWIQFSQVRVPRDNMLSRWAKVIYLLYKNIYLIHYENITHYIIIHSLYSRWRKGANTHHPGGILYR